jgi:hypothetical protein
MAFISKLSIFGRSQEGKTRSGVRPAQPPCSSARYSAQAGVSASSHADGLVLLNANDGRVFTANLIAAQIWERVLNGSNAESIAAEIADRYQMDLSDAERDVAAFLSDLCSRRLLRVSEDAA